MYCEVKDPDSMFVPNNNKTKYSSDAQMCIHMKGQIEIKNVYITSIFIHYLMRNLSKVTVFFFLNAHNLTMLRKVMKINAGPSPLQDQHIYWVLYVLSCRQTAKLVFFLNHFTTKVCVLSFVCTA